MDPIDRRHGLELIDRYALEQERILCLHAQIQACTPASGSADLKTMLQLCILEVEDRKKVISNAFRFLLNVSE